MGSRVEIKWNGNFERDLKKLVGEETRRMASESTRACDRVLASHSGQPAEAVAPAPQRELKRVGVTLTNPELAEYAAAISEGRRIVFEAKVR